jgi:hypothetical protein
MLDVRVVASIELQDDVPGGNDEREPGVQWLLRRETPLLDGLAGEAR